MTLIDLKPGQRGTVVGWSPRGLPSRILEMGLLPGTLIELVRFAPLGDPIDFKIRGYHLSLRKREAELVLVDPT
jgi:Fe2+ transport system protein FeoA